MNWEEISALSTFATLLVIAASAIAAVIQLRHMRSSNTIVGFTGFMDRWASPAAREIANHVFNGDLERKLEDPAYRQMLRSGRIDPIAHPEIQYLDFWESLGMLVKLGYFQEDAVMESGGPVAVRAWQHCMPLIAILRGVRGPTAYDNFEYLVSRSILWEERHPGGIFPSNTPHLPVIDPYPEDPKPNGA
ncbi:MAG: hypothetical protein JO219_01625 [Candidatus Eremiobacteraeota bacterium]|nr:hypothetical protein [Candidatus Eremiobacteraeota bacterium]MBV8366100.1 hypothetical protein [Candidatus Eremiobacteraeota bacterium]